MHHKYIFYPYHPFATFARKVEIGFVDEAGKPALKGWMSNYLPKNNPDIAAVYKVAGDAFERLTQDPYSGKYAHEHPVSSPAEFDASVTSQYVDDIDYAMSTVVEQIELGGIKVLSESDRGHIGPDELAELSYPSKVEFLWEISDRLGDRSDVAPVFRILFLIATLDVAGDVLIAMCLDGRGQSEASAQMYGCYHSALAIEAEYNIANKVRQQIGKHAVTAKLAKDKKQKAKCFVYECWCDWQKGKREYASQAIFARDMLDKKGDVLVSHASIETWCRQWKKGENLPLIEPAE